LSYGSPPELKGTFNPYCSGFLALAPALKMVSHHEESVPSVR